MSFVYMRSDLEAVSTDFTALRELRARVVATVEAIEHRVAGLKKAHEDLVASSPPAACALGLDSLHFQVKLVSMELASLREMVRAVENHLYYECHYLHRSIQEYAKEHISNQAARDRIAIDRDYPPFKHLDKGASYDFDVTVGLHAQLVSSVGAMDEFIVSMASAIEAERGKSAQGLNIASLVHSNAYVHALVSAKVVLFCNTLAAFNQHHCKYMRRIKDKAQLVLDAITKDVRMDGEDPGETTTVAKAAALSAPDTPPAASASTSSTGDTSVAAPQRLTDRQIARRQRKRERAKEKKRERASPAHQPAELSASSDPEQSTDASREANAESSSPVSSAEREREEVHSESEPGV